jgi:Zn finger protein HypA/HybF involved in hydrogenase expression
LYEEYEALRLSDFNNLNHHQASQEMGVSRPTFTRIYASALQTIAKAFVEGRQISIEGGKVYFDSNWYHCENCTCYFNNPEKVQQIKNCPLCGSPDVLDYNLDNSSGDIRQKKNPKCNH